MTRRLRLLALGALLLFPAAALADDSLHAGPVTASSITHESARVTGRVTEEEGARYRFDYGVGSYSTSTPWVYVSSDTTATSDLIGLRAGSTYQIRLVAQDTEAVRYGYGSFATAAAPVSPPPPAGETPAPPTGEAPTTEPEPEPELGSTVALAATRGTVRVRTLGSTGFVALGDLASLPVGTVVDASRGRVELESALPDGTTQTGSFHGSRFQIRQSAAGDGRVNLHLRGGELAGCRSRGDESAQASAAAKPKRRLWGSDSGGRFRTHGRDSVATVRGTRWSVTDRCDGTLTRVTDGAVDVRVRATGRVVRVDAGERHFARHRR